jgi:hypothetical protein
LFLTCLLGRASAFCLRLLIAIALALLAGLLLALLCLNGLGRFVLAIFTGPGGLGVGVTLLGGTLFLPLLFLGRLARLLLLALLFLPGLFGPRCSLRFDGFTLPSLAVGLRSLVALAALG